MEKREDDNIFDILQRIKINLVNIEKRLENIEHKLECGEKNVEVLKDELTSIKSSTAHMDNHISFVENVYDNVKSPLFYVLQKLSFTKIKVNERAAITNEYSN